MEYLSAAFMGLLQGVTEFLPVSSSGHLSLFQNFFNGQAPDALFNVLLHFATLLAVFVYYWHDIADMIAEFFRGAVALVRRDGSETAPPARRLVLMVILATLPLVVVLPFKSKVEALGASTLFIGCALLVTGLLLFACDRLRPGRKNERTMTVTDALLIGCAQALAVVPGLSRSGTTISAGTARGLDRTFAVRFSFLMSLPAVLGATLLEVIDAAKTGVDPALIPKYILGMAVAAVSGYFAIRLVNLLAKKGRFGAFAYYCWAVGIVTIIATFVLK